MEITIDTVHHARFDGNGYTYLKRKEIQLEKRIAALANDFDHLTAGKTKMGKRSVEECIEMINEGAGTWYDPDLVKVFNKIWRQLRRD